MAKFSFPVSTEKLRKVLSSPEGLEALRPLGTDNNVDFAISCLKGGYVNKMHHKTRQEEDRALLEMLKNDPELKKRVEGKAAAAVKKVG
jgi:hypothetical protein